MFLSTSEIHGYLFNIQKESGQGCDISRHLLIY